MLYVVILAHLLGDYLFQWEFIVRWKVHSLMGVLAHGGIVTITTLVCTRLVAPSWWPYALLIGLTHTVIDLVRVRLLHTVNPTWELIWYLFDQMAHLITIVLVVLWSGDYPWTGLNGTAGLLADRRVLAYIIGYLLLTNPAWVLLRFTVRGIWGSTAAPPLGEGEKYGPMVERVLIASCVLTGQFHLIPLVLLPRRLVPIRMQENGAGVLTRLTSHWAETLLSVLLAIMVGLALRVINPGG